MLKPTRNIYTIKTSPYNDNEKLENLLNEMSKDGWDLYSMQELENNDDVFYNCIFIKEVDYDNSLQEEDDLFNIKPKIERIISPELEPYDLCIDILKKIKEKRQKIAQVKALIDDTLEDSRAILNEEISKHIVELQNLKKHLSEVINPDIMESKLGENRLTLSISEELTDIIDDNNEDNILSQIVFIRQNLTETLGYIIPKIKIEIDDTLDENEFTIKLHGIPVISGYAYRNYSMYLKGELNIEKLPEDSINSHDNITGIDTIWINDEISKDYWIKGISATEYISTVIEYVILKYIDDIFDYSDINRYLEIVGNQNLYLVDNLVPDFLSISELKYILSNLIKEKVSIKNIVYIFEKLNDLIGEEDKENLLAKLRISLARQISSSVCDENNTIQAYELTNESLKPFDLNNNNEDEVIRIESNKLENIINKIQKLQEENVEEKELILIAPMEIRHVVYLILSQMVTNIRVLAREELLFEYPLKILGKI